jgi:electron transfer flavoprotein beta subunit
MKIVALVKQVLDTEAKIRIASSGLDVEREGETRIINPYDEYAVEEALRIRDGAGGGEVTVISLGTEKAKEMLRHTVAMGADSPILIYDPLFDGIDPAATALVLTRALAKVGYDLILCGKQAIDDDSAYVPIAIAELLDLPHTAVVTKLEIADGAALAQRETDAGIEVLRVPLPCVITCQKGLNEPRYPSLPGMMKAKRKEIPVWSAADLGVDGGSVQENTMATVRSLSLPPPRTPGRLLEGDPTQQAADLLRALREEKKVL